MKPTAKLLEGCHSFLVQSSSNDKGYDMIANPLTGQVLVNANPKGCNQYSGKECIKVGDRTKMKSEFDQKRRFHRALTKIGYKKPFKLSQKTLGKPVVRVIPVGGGDPLSSDMLIETVMAPNDSYVDIRFSDYRKDRSGFYKGSKRVVRPGSLDLGRKLKTLVKSLKEEGFGVGFTATDEHKDEVYQRSLSKLGLSQTGEESVHGGIYREYK